jgi:hypothetical protein
MAQIVFASIAIWIAFGLLSVLVGLGLRARLFDTATDDAQGWLAAFWTGWCALVAFLQLFHLVHRIDVFALVSVVALALIGAWLGRNDIARTLRRGARGRVGLVIITTVGAGWLALQASRWPGNYDTGLYHIHAIKWNNACPIVPGLGNFYFRLAYNNSSFLFAALMQVAPPHEAVHLASGLLVLALLFQLLIAGRELIRRPDELSIMSLATLAMAPAIMLQVLEPTIPVPDWSPSWNPYPPSNLSSPTPDLVVYALGIALTPHTIALLWRQLDGKERARDAALLTVIAMACVGVTVKLSFAVFAGLMLAISLFAWWRDTRDGKALARMARLLVLFGALSVGVWLLRGIILSGYFAYPDYKLGSLPVPWRVPVRVASRDYIGMQCWARNPGDCTGAIGNWRWIEQWFDRELFSYWRRLGLPLSLAGCGLLLAILTSFGAPRRARPWQTWLILLPPVAASVFCFVTMPLGRYLGSTLWCLVGGTVALSLAHLDRRGAATGVALLALLLSLDSVRMAQKPVTGLEVAPHRDGSPYRTDSGLWISAMPNTGTQVWDADLLTTPSPLPSLRQRVVGELCKGFEAD